LVVKITWNALFSGGQFIRIMKLFNLELYFRCIKALAIESLPTRISLLLVSTILYKIAMTRNCYLLVLLLNSTELLLATSTIAICPNNSLNPISSIDCPIYT